MRIFVAVCLTVLAVSVGEASMYEWVDSEGVTHFTDNPDKVPAKYRKKVKERESIQGESPSAAPAPPPTTAPAAESGKAEDQSLRGGHDEGWWRASFAVIREELDGIQSNLPAKREKLTNLHRKHLLYQKPSDRTTYNELNAEIERDGARLKELQEKLRALEGDADRAGVPAEWRR